jgi:hypothetical protein
MLYRNATQKILFLAVIIDDEFKLEAGSKLFLDK